MGGRNGAKRLAGLVRNTQPRVENTIRARLTSTISKLILASKIQVGRLFAYIQAARLVLFLRMASFEPHHQDMIAGPNGCDRARQ
jgi:hypothetical protein